MTRPFVHRPPAADERPLIVSIPHTGTALFEGLSARLTPEASRLPDTDFFLDQLYDFVPGMGGHLLHGHYSRYVIDLNRPPTSAPLYPGRFETGLVPMRTFSDQPVYREGQAPDEAECADRRTRYWVPYHQALQGLIDELQGRHGEVWLFEAHSIRGRVPTLFEGALPDLVLGTADGTSTAPAHFERARAVAEATGRELSVNAPFKGGWNTRHYGAPAAGVHALQLEMAWRLYMDEAEPYVLDAARAARLVPDLEAIVRAFSEQRSL